MISEEESICDLKNKFSINDIESNVFLGIFEFRHCWMTIFDLDLHIRYNKSLDL